MKTLALILLITGSLYGQDYSNKTLVYPFYPRSESGEVYKNIKQGDICIVGYTKTVRNVKTRTRHQVFAKYGITKGHYREYEVDHFISLALGGDNSLENLFPQPYEVYLTVNGKNVRMGAREKDVVESNLHRRICRGEFTMKQAQEIITTNWVGYYLKLKKKI